MKRIVISISMMIAILAMPFFKIEAKAETDMISDLKWENNGTEANPLDDTLTFTAPEGYRDLSSIEYTYGLASEGNSTYGIGPYNATMDANGKVTVSFFYSGTYGHGFEYSYTVKLFSKDNAILGNSNTVKYSFPLTELTEPKNISIYENKKVVFDTVFGAEKYVLDIYSPEEKTKLASVSSKTNQIPFDNKYLTVKNIFKVTASNDTYNLTPKTGRYVVGAITDLKWNENSVKDDPSDDTLTFTAPEGYRDPAASGITYSLVSYDAEGKVLGTVNITTKNIAINTDTGLSVIHIAGLNQYASGFDLHYAVSLKETKDKVTTTLLTSNVIDKTFTARQLKAPKNVSLTGQRFSWDAVFGATSYVVTITDAEGKELKEYSVTEPYQYIDDEYMVSGNVISIVAKNWDAKQISAANLYTIKTDVNIEKVKAFVKTLYATTLDRDPDDDGMNYWLDQLSSGKKTGA